MHVPIRLFDVNSDGVISKKEMKRLVKDMYGLLKKEDPNISAADLIAKSAFAEMDKDEDGKLDIQSLMKDFATDAITVPFLGAKIGALQGSEEGKEMAYGATRILEIWSQLMYYPPWLYKIHPKTTELGTHQKYLST